MTSPHPASIALSCACYGKGSRSLFLISVNDCGHGVVRGRPEECVYVRAQRRGGGKEEGQRERHCLMQALLLLFFSVPQLNPPPPPRLCSFLDSKYRKLESLSLSKSSKFLRSLIALCCEYIGEGGMGRNITTEIDLYQYCFHCPYTYMIDTSTHFQLLSSTALCQVRLIASLKQQTR